MRKAVMILMVITIIFSGTIAVFATDMIDINQGNKELDEFIKWAYENQIDIFFPEQEQVNNLLNIEIGNNIEEIKEFLLSTKEGINLTPINEYKNTKEDNGFINNDLNDLLDNDNIMSSEFEFYDNITYTRRGFILRTDQKIGDIEIPDLEASVRYSYYDVLDYGKVFEEIKNIILMTMVYTRV